MAAYTYVPTGICAKKIDYAVEDGVVTKLNFTGGCPGNLEAIAQLVVGLPVNQVVQKLQGILCQNGTSCADQLSKALSEQVK